MTVALCSLCNQEQEVNDMLYSTASCTYECLNTFQCKKNRPKKVANKKKSAQKTSAGTVHSDLSYFGIDESELVKDNTQFRDGVVRYTHPPTGNRYHYSRFDSRGWLQILSVTSSHDDFALARDPEAL